MKKASRILAWAAAAMLAQWTGGNLLAQQGGGGGGRGNFDPAQMQARMMERMREQMDVKDDAAWNIIQTRLEKVMEARREVGFGGMGRGMFRGPGGPGGQGGQGGDQAQGQNQRRRGFGGEPSEEAQALQKAIDDKAPAEEIKAKMAKYREARKAREAKLQAAQEELRKVVTARQEGILVLNGTLN